MKAREIFNRRVPVAETAFCGIGVMGSARATFRQCPSLQVPASVRSCVGSVLRYDNEPRKGDHKHVLGREMKYRFVSVDRLVADFFEDVKRWRDENSDN